MPKLNGGTFEIMGIRTRDEFHVQHGQTLSLSLSLITGYNDLLISFPFMKKGEGKLCDLKSN